MESLAPGDPYSWLDEPSTHHPLPDSFWWPSPPPSFLPPPARQSFIGDPYLSQSAPSLPYTGIPTSRASFSPWAYQDGNDSGRAVVGYTHFTPPGEDEGAPRVFYASQSPIAPPPLSYSIPSTFITDHHTYPYHQSPATPQHPHPRGYYPPPLAHTAGIPGHLVPKQVWGVPRTLRSATEVSTTYWPPMEVQVENRKAQMQSYVENVRREKRREREKSRASDMASKVTKEDRGDDVVDGRFKTESRHYNNTMTEVIAYRIPKLVQDQLYIWRIDIWIYHLALDPDGLPTQHVTFTFQRKFAPGHSLVLHVTPMSPWERHDPRRWPDELFYNVAHVAYPPQWALPRDRLVDHEAYVKWERARHRWAMCKDEMGRGTRWARTLAREHMLEVRWRPKPPREMEKWVVTEGGEPFPPRTAPGLANSSALKPLPAYTVAAVAAPIADQGKSTTAGSGEDATDPAPGVESDLTSNPGDSPTLVLSHWFSTEHPSHTPSPTNIPISDSTGTSVSLSAPDDSHQPPSHSATGTVTLDSISASQPAAGEKKKGVWDKGTVLPPGLLAKFRKMAM